MAGKYVRRNAVVVVVASAVASASSILAPSWFGDRKASAAKAVPKARNGQVSKKAPTNGPLPAASPQSREVRPPRAYELLYECGGESSSKSDVEQCTEEFLLSANGYIQGYAQRFVDDCDNSFDFPNVSGLGEAENFFTCIEDDFQKHVAKPKRVLSSADQEKLGYSQASATDLREECGGLENRNDVNSVVDCVDNAVRVHDHIGSSTTGGDQVIEDLNAVCARVLKGADASADFYGKADLFYGCIEIETGPNPSVPIKFFEQAMEDGHIFRTIIGNQSGRVDCERPSRVSSDFGIG